MPNVLVTGASRGLGLEFVRQYVKEGWHVLACARNSKTATTLQQIVSSAPEKITIHNLDLLDHASIEKLAQTLHSTAIDVLINCAGTMGASSFASEGLKFGPFGQSNFADWSEVFHLNIIAPMKMAETFVEHVARSEQKKIITLSSIVGSVGHNKIGGLYAYRASKSAVNAVMRSMAIDLAKTHGIAATALHPGWVRTEMGGPRADIDATESIAGMRNVIANLTIATAGRYWVYDGSELPW